MEKKEILNLIDKAEITWTVMDLKTCIFADDLRGGEITEVIAESVFHNFSLVKDALVRTGHTVENLEAEAERFAQQFPDSYSGEDFEWAIWDAADGFVYEALERDSRIVKRWEELETDVSSVATVTRGWWN